MAASTSRNTHQTTSELPTGGDQTKRSRTTIRDLFLYDHSRLRLWSSFDLIDR